MSELLITLPPPEVVAVPEIPAAPPGQPSIWEKIDEIWSRVPEEEMVMLPEDGAEHRAIRFSAPQP